MIFGNKTRFDEVFGIQNELLKYTYVNSAKLDERLDYLLKTQRQIVIHGASKQGKTSLRKKVFKNRQFVVIQCLLDKKISDILNDIKRALNPYITKEKKTGNDSEYNGKLGGEV
jgi:low affinity Fe/Cu permease